MHNILFIKDIMFWQMPLPMFKYEFVKCIMQKKRTAGAMRIGFKGGLCLISSLPF